MIYRIRATAATGGDQVFRDIEVRDTDSLEDLHNILVQSFGLDGNELASFYTTDDELNMIDEIPLFNMDASMQGGAMANVQIKDVLNREMPKLIYIYDYLNMWQFLIELLEQGPEIPGRTYPALIYAYGQLPENPPEPEFDIENLNESFEEEDQNDDLWDDAGDDLYYDDEW
jgi:hypothetical protein